MKIILVFAEIVVSVLLTICVLLQAKGAGFGSGMILGQTYATKRGLEKAVFIATMVLGGLFAVFSLALLVA